MDTIQKHIASKTCKLDKLLITVYTVSLFLMTLEWTIVWKFTFSLISTKQKKIIFYNAPYNFFLNLTPTKKFNIFTVLTIQTLLFIKLNI